MSGPDVALDAKGLTAYLAPIADEVKVDPEDASVVLGKSTVTLNEDVAGQELDMPAAIAAVQQAALARRRGCPLLFNFPSKKFQELCIGPHRSRPFTTGPTAPGNKRHEALV